MGKADIKMQKAGNTLKVEMAGTIDEDVDFSQFKLSGSESIELELEGLKSINSCGIREWIKWIGTAGAAPISFVKCPKVIVDQMNMVDGFLPATGRVESFYVPFYNDESGDEKNVLFRNGTEFKDDGTVKAPQVQDSEGHDMEMDVIESKYFKFIKRK